MHHTLVRALVPLVLVLALACGTPPPQTGEEPQIPAPTQVESMVGFSWIVEGDLAAMPRPGRERPLQEDAAFLHDAKITTLISLTEDLPDPGVFEDLAIRQVHIPVEDFTAPTLEQMIEFVAVVSESVDGGQSVGVHCTAGLGRSGTMSAAYLVSRGLSAEAAITSVRELRPGSIETDAQEQAVRRAQTHFHTGQ